MSGGGKSSTSTSSVSIPPEVLARYNAVNARAEEVAKQGFTPYSGEFVAPLSPTQQAGIYNISQAAGTAQPYYQQAYGALLSGAAQAQPYYQAAAQGLSGGQAAASPLQQAAAANITGAQAGAQPYQQMATGYGLAGARQIDPRALDVGAYMSPYVEAVAQPTLQAMRQQQEQEQQRILGEQIRGGAFGGDRGRIAQAVLAQQQNMATAKAMGDIYQQGYGQALGAAQQQQQLGLAAEQANRQAQQQAAQQFLGIGQQAFGQGMSAAQQQAALANQLFSQGASAAQVQQALGQGLYGMGAGVSQGLGGIGAGAQQAGLQGGQAQLAAGTVEQQTQQALNQALYNQFLQQQGYPFQVAQFLANIAMGTGALSGSTTTTTQPSSFFSDERLKHDIEPIGKTFDGQDIVRFKYKGEPGTRIGLVAQDVEKKHPEAVGLAGGYKTVDYDKATDEAAERAPHKAYGGGLSPWEGNSMGGGVFREDAGQGFAVGGAPGGDDILAQINALVNAHQGMFPYGKTGLYGSGMGKAGPYGSTLMQAPSRGLMTAPPVRQEPPYDARQAMRDVRDISQMPETISKGYSGLKAGLIGAPEQTRTVTSPSGQTTTEVTQPASSGLLGRAGEVNLRESGPARTYRELESAIESAFAPSGNARGGAIRQGLAVGGMPYGEARDEYIPEELTKPLMPQTLQPARAPAPQQSGLGNIASLAGLGSKAWEAGVPFLKDAAAGIGSYLGGLGGAAEGAGAIEGAELLALAALSRGGVAPRRGYERGGGPENNVPEGYLDYISSIESGGNPLARNPLFPVERGGPEGRHQFTRDTWLDLARNDPRFEGQSEEQILAARRDPTVSSLYAVRYGQQNAPVLRAAGLDPTQENLALAHMQGPGGARALLTNPTLNVVDALMPVYGNNRERVMQVISQNRGNPEMSAADFSSHLLRARGPAPGLGLPASESGASAPNAGLAGAERRQQAAPEEKDWLRDRFNKNEYWLVPLLTGLGTMAASPSRYLGSAALQGLMGAGQAYQQTLGAEGMRAKTAEETKKVTAETGRTLAQSQEIYARIAASAESPDRRTVRIFRNGRFILIPREEFWRNPSQYSMYAVPYSEDERRQFQAAPSRGEPLPGGEPSPQPPRAPSAPGGEGTAAPADGRQDASAVPPPNVPTTRSVEGDITLIPALTEETRNLADREASRSRQYSPNELPVVAERTRDVFNPGRARAASAAASLPDRVNLAKEFMALPDQDWGSLGRTTQFVTPILAWVNSTLSTFNVPDPRNPSQTLQFNADRLARLEALDKEAIQNALRQQGDSGARAYRELEQILSATPNTRMSRQAIEKILATNFSAEQRAIDFDNFLNLWRNYVTEPRENAVGINENELRLTGPQAEREFERIYGATFGKEKTGIEKILGSMAPDGRPLIEHIIETRGAPSQHFVDYINRNFANEGGARLLRYFYGR